MRIISKISEQSKLKTMFTLQHTEKTYVMWIDPFVINKNNGYFGSKSTHTSIEKPSPTMFSHMHTTLLNKASMSAFGATEDCHQNEY